MRMTDEYLKEARAALKANFSKWPRESEVFRLARQTKQIFPARPLDSSALPPSTVEYFEFTRRVSHQKGAGLSYDVFLGEQRIGMGWVCVYPADD